MGFERTIERGERKGIQEHAQRKKNRLLISPHCPPSELRSRRRPRTEEHIAECVAKLGESGTSG
eukprot:302319-Amorphochlora_amoeboformis.AAC.1